MFTLIADTLTDKGYDVYSLGKHKGECTKPFILVKETIPGVTSHRSLNSQVVDIYIFYPLGRYTQVMPFISRLEEDMKDIKVLEPIHDSNPIIIDEEKVAYTTRLSYQIIRRRK